MAGPQNAARRIARLRAVVAKDAAPYVIGGVSAKSIRKRFDDAAIEKLPLSDTCTKASNCFKFISMLPFHFPLRLSW